MCVCIYIDAQIFYYVRVVLTLSLLTSLLKPFSVKARYVSIIKVDLGFLYNALMTKHALLLHVSPFFMLILHNFIGIHHIINSYF